MGARVGVDDVETSRGIIVKVCVICKWKHCLTVTSVIFDVDFPCPPCIFYSVNHVSGIGYATVVPNCCTSRYERRVGVIPTTCKSQIIWHAWMSNSSIVDSY